jgi:hypothetical protein
MEWKVWYHTEVKQLGGGYKKGTLTVDDGRATLATDEGGTIELAPIRSVGRQRVSLWLYWVHVRLGRHARLEHEDRGGAPGRAGRRRAGARRALGLEPEERELAQRQQVVGT